MSKEIKRKLVKQTATDLLKIGIITKEQYDDIIARKKRKEDEIK